MMYILNCKLLSNGCAYKIVNLSRTGSLLSNHFISEGQWGWHIKINYIILFHCKYLSYQKKKFFSVKCMSQQNQVMFQCLSQQNQVLVQCKKSFSIVKCLSRQKLVLFRCKKLCQSQQKKKVFHCKMSVTAIFVCFSIVKRLSKQKITVVPL